MSPTQRTLPYWKYYDDSNKSSELLRRFFFYAPQIYYAVDPSRRGKMSVIPRKWCPHKVSRDSKSQGDSKNTTRSQFTTRSIFKHQRSPEWSFRSFRRNWWRTSGEVWKEIFELLLLGKIVRSIFHQNSTANFTIRLHYEVLGCGGPYLFSTAGSFGHLTFPLK